MIAQNDLDADLAAGVAQGIITDAQATALRALAAEREKARAAALGNEERFRFMRGFNDFFFASGVLLFGAGAAFFAATAPISNLVGAAMMWALAELLVARLRLVLPGLLLVVFLAYFVSLAVPVESWVGGLAHAGFAPRVSFLDALGGNRAVGSTRGLLIAIAGLAFFARFRFPFALLAVAGGLVIAVMALARASIPGSSIRARCSPAAAASSCSPPPWRSTSPTASAPRDAPTAPSGCISWRRR